MLAPPPVTPTLPRASIRIALARTIALPLVCWVWPIAQMMKPGRLSESIFAVSNISFSETPVMSATTSGGYFAMTSSLTLSMPQTRSEMYFLSSQPFLNTWYSRPMRKATSEPERVRTYLSAFAAVRV